MRLLLCACVSILFATQSFALSCLESSIEDSFIQHSKAEEAYILVTGTLKNKRSVILGPKTPGVGAQSENFTATFVGQQGTRAGFEAPLKTTVAVTGGCGGPWCGSVTVDVPMLTFLEVTSYGHKLTVGPCGGAVFYNPSKDLKQRALRCLRGGVCRSQFR